MKGEIILHIGTPKTATSALQLFLSRNRERLAENGICYPVFKDQRRKMAGELKNTESFNGNGTALRFSFNKDSAQFSLQSRRKYRKIMNAAQKYRKVILSGEDFFDMAGREFYRNFAKQGNKVTVVCYLRRQDKYLESLWGYFIKAYGDFNYKCIDFCRSEEIKKHYETDYLSRIETICEYVGRENVAVRSFDCLEGDIYHDFFTAIGEPWDDLLQIGQERINEKLPLEMTEVKRRLNEQCAASLRTMNQAVAWTAKENASLLTNRGSFLTAEQKREICGNCRAGNNRLEQEYMDGRQLFSYEYREDYVCLEESVIQALYAETLERIVCLQEQQIKDGLRKGAAGILWDKVCRTLRKYAVLMNLSDERLANSFVRRVDYSKKPD